MDPPNAGDSDAWVSLFSGGKDSSWALYRALEAGLPVARLVTVHPDGDSYMYHVPATRLASLAAESIGIPLVDVEPGRFDTMECVESSERGDRELEPLERALARLDDELAAGIGGVITGAVESDYQRSRIEGLVDRLSAELFAPLWQRDPRSLAAAILDAGFEIVIVQVAARGLDESWLGRTLDRHAFSELFALRERYGVHPLGEGGEFETVVVDGPHMTRRIELEYRTIWEGDRGHLEITDARLE